MVLAYVPALIYLLSVGVLWAQEPTRPRIAIALAGTALGSACLGLAFAYAGLGSNGVAVATGLVTFAVSCPWIIAATKRKRHQTER
jgi:hypothetical protein